MRKSIVQRYYDSLTILEKWCAFFQDIVPLIQEIQEDYKKHEEFENCLLLDRLNEQNRLATSVESIKETLTKIESIELESCSLSFQRIWNDVFIGGSRLKKRLYKCEDNQKKIKDKLESDYSQKQIDSLSSDFEDIYSIFDSLYESIDELSVLVYSVYLLFLCDKTNSLVLIGANGAGKSRLVKRMVDGFHNDTHIIYLAALHNMYYLDDEEDYSEYEPESLREFQSDSKVGAVSYYNREFNLLLDTLNEERLDIIYDYYYGGEKRESVLEKVRKEWNKLFEEVRLEFDRESIYPELNNGNDYDINLLSDGEKNSLYYLAHVLYAKENSIIIVDEPEVHLHSDLCIKLWNILESLRTDCKFIYITHSLNFAESRKEAKIVWNEKFIYPFSWSLHEIEVPEGIPDALVYQILGAKQNLLLCEGKNDIRLFSLLFPDYNIKSVGAHSDVIKHTKALKDIQDKFHLNVNIIGLIDRDWHEDEYLLSIKKDNIYAIRANEVENIFCDERVLRQVADGLERGDTVREYMKEFWNLFENKIEILSRSIVVYRLNSKLSRNMFNLEDKFSFIQEKMSELCSIDSLENEKEMWKDSLQEIAKTKDYDKAIKVTNFKNELIRIADKIITKPYIDAAIREIKNSEELKNYLISKYCDEDMLVEE